MDFHERFVCTFGCIFHIYKFCVNNSFIKVFTKNLRLLASAHDLKEPVWKDHVVALNKVVDCFGRLDLLKDMKGQMKNDFARYKRYI